MQATEKPFDLTDVAPGEASFGEAAFGEAAFGEADDDGYIMAQMALLLIPLLLFAALATDLGYWYVRGQQAQGAADAAALAGAALLPDRSAAYAEALAVAEMNGFTDSTPADAGDFLTGPLPQLSISSPSPGLLEVRTRQAEQSFLSKLLLDTVEVERFAIAGTRREVKMGNPSSVLGSGTLNEIDLGVPPSLSWLAINAYCTDAERGDHLMAGYTNGIEGRAYQTCGPTPGDVAADAMPNPNFDPDAYVFVVEMAPGSAPVDVDIFEPGASCDPAANSFVTGDGTQARIHYRIYGPSESRDHRNFVSTRAPIASGLLADDACFSNAPNGDGWFPLASALPAPGPDGGFYYVQLATRSPALPDFDPADSYWAESGINYYSLRAAKSGTGKGCIYSSIDTLCPRLYGLDWLPLYRNLAGSEASFYVTEIGPEHAGSTITVSVFDAADGADNIQFENPDGESVPFRYRWADQSGLGLSTPGYRETDFVDTSSTCMWEGSGGNPCLLTTPFEAFNDHLLRIEIDIPDDYECGGNCWWRVRYTSSSFSDDRTNWRVQATGDPLRLVE